MAEVRGGIALLWLGWCVFFGTFAHGYLENTDAVCTLHAARAWWLRGDPGLLREGPDTTPAERELAAMIAERGSFGMTGRNGRQYVWFPIGHQLLMVPGVAAGRALAGAFPEIEQRFADRADVAWSGLFFERFLLSFLPALAAAGTATLLYLLARTLGRSARESLLVMAVATLATQLWPGASETLSDAPGMFLLALCAWLVVRARELAPSPRTLLLAGVAGGLATLVRYPHAVPVAVLGLAAAFGARPRALRAALWFAAGVAPSLAFLLAANWLRFGDLLETGYSAGANAQTSFPLWLGLPCVLLAPGKGILWFSPPLWPALAQLRGRLWRWPLGPFALALLASVLIVASRSFWSGGQCWGIRYLTATIVLFVTVALAVGRPWLRRPRWFWACVALGALIQLGGVLTPYRGHQELALAATGVVYPDAVPRPGRGDTRENNATGDPRFSPLHGHWLYAWLSATGALAEGGAANTTIPLFGVEVPPPAKPSQPEDVAFRHWWLPYLGWRLGFAAWPWWLLSLATGITLLLVASRRLRKSDDPLGPGRP